MQIYMALEIDLSVFAYVGGIRKSKVAIGPGDTTYDKIEQIRYWVLKNQKTKRK